MSDTNLTYAQILTTLPAYDERDDPAYLSMIPTWINLAENRLATEMKQQGFQAVVNGAFALSNVQAKPTFWRETISFGFSVGGVYQQLFIRTLEYCRAYWPSTAETTNAPKYYADYNISHFYLAGTPDQAYPFQLVYYARLDPLTASNQENWMTLNVPQALLYAILIESAMWRKDSAMQQSWTQAYASALQGILAENQERIADRGMVVERG